MKNLRLTRDETIAAAKEWNFNCGPGALCAVLGRTAAEIRPALLNFEEKGYTNPTLMCGVLSGLAVPYRVIYRGDEPCAQPAAVFPLFGLVRLQFAGPWTDPRVPMRVRYRKTHWVAASGAGATRRVFDINAMDCGGWLPWEVWADQLMPWLIRECHPKASGQWWPTHSLEIDR